MDNLHLLSIKFQETELKLKIRKYKVFICIFWIISLTLFITLMYFNNSNKKLKTDINISKTKPSYKQEEKLMKKVGTINNFIDFYNDSNNGIFNNITINDTQLVLNAIIQDKNQFYSIIHDYEQSNKYNIVYLSPLSDYNNKYSFQLTLEVKK